MIKYSVTFILIFYTSNIFPDGSNLCVRTNHEQVDTNQITLLSNVNDDNVFLDGEYLGSTPIEVELPRKNREILLRFDKDSYSPAILKIDSEYAPTHIRVYLEKSINSAAVPKNELQTFNDIPYIQTEGADSNTMFKKDNRHVDTKRLTLRSQLDDDRVFLDGRYLGSTKLDAEIRSDKKEHVIRIAKNMYHPAIIRVHSEHLPSQINVNLREQWIPDVFSSKDKQKPVHLWSKRAGRNIEDIKFSKDNNS